MPEVNRAQFPEFNQPQLPGMGGSGRQMPLFKTEQAGDIPANVYSKFDEADAGQWTEPQDFELSGEESRVLSDPSGGRKKGMFFDFNSFPHSTERQHQAFEPAHERAREQEGVLGYEHFPKQPNPDLQFDDLQSNFGVSKFGSSNFDDFDDFDDEDEGLTFTTPEGSEVGKVSFHEDEWGPAVEEAEINPLYKGRGWSGDAMAEFVSGAEGVVHAGGFTPAGQQAFRQKGIPTSDDLEQSFDEYKERDLRGSGEEDEEFGSEYGFGGMDPDVDTELREEFTNQAMEMQQQAVEQHRRGRSRKGGGPPMGKKGTQEKLFAADPHSSPLATQFP